jgi:hypothetical protein
VSPFSGDRYIVVGLGRVVSVFFVGEWIARLANAGVLRIEGPM